MPSGRPLPISKYTRYVAKRPGYIPPLLKPDKDGKVRPFIGFRRKDTVLQKPQAGLGGPFTRIKRIQTTLHKLFLIERIEGGYTLLNETRMYAERLIELAQLGPQNSEVMKFADYYLTDKRLIHKLFKVIVPRNSEQFGAATAIYRVPPKGDGRFFGQTKERAILELVGNPFPALEPDNCVPSPKSLLNVLVSGAKQEFENEYINFVKGLSSTTKAMLKTPGNWTSLGPHHSLSRK